MANCCNEYHQQQLAKHCQVCTANYSRTYRYPCKMIKEELWACLGINQGANSPHIQPSTPCLICKEKMIRKAANINTSLGVYDWVAHEDSRCSVCKMFCSQSAGGLPKKTNRGRPKKGKQQMDCLEECSSQPWGAPHPLGLILFLPPPATGPKLEDLQCCVRQCIVDRPIETSCRKLACLARVIQSTDDIIPTPAANIIVKVHGSEGVMLKAHRNSGCSISTTHPSLELTASQILSHPSHAECRGATGICGCQAAHAQRLRTTALGQMASGLRLLGEQGAESIHTSYNHLNRIYDNIHSGVDRSDRGKPPAYMSSAGK